MEGLVIVVVVVGLAILFLRGFDRIAGRVATGGQTCLLTLST